MGNLRYSILAPSPRPVIDITMTPATLDVLDFMQDYDVLPSTYIHAQFASADWTRKIIKNLGKAHLIRVPKGYQHNNAHYRPRPLEVTDLGRRELEKVGRLRKRERMNDHFAHAYLRSVIEHSFRQAPKELPALKYHDQADILSHPNTPPATVKEPNPSWFEALGHVVRPDAPLFGYEYRDAFMFFHGFEADRATERQTSDTYAKKTISKMLEQYADYLTRGVFRSKYGLSQITVLIVTVGQQRIDNMLDIVRTLDPAVQKRFAFKALPNFLLYDALPPPTGHMVTENWQRVDGPFNFLDTLKETALKKQKGGEHN